MEVIKLNSSFFKKLVLDLQSQPSGEWVAERLDNQGLVEILNDLVRQSANFPGLRINSNIRATIQDKKGKVSGGIDINHPKIGDSRVQVDLVFGNHTDPGKIAIVTERLSVVPNLSLRAKFALMAVGINLDDKIREILDHPQTSLVKFFRSQLDAERLTLEGLAATFTEDNHLDLNFMARKRNR